MNRITTARSYVGLGLILFSLGCSDMTAADRNSLSLREVRNEFVRVTLDREYYAQGDTVVISVRNISGQSLGYNFCPTSLEKRDGDEWKALDDPSQRVCTLPLHMLSKGSRTEIRYLLDHNLEDGTYRVVLPTPFPERGEFTGDYVLNSASFTVMPHRVISMQKITLYKY